MAIKFETKLADYKGAVVQVDITGLNETQLEAIDGAFRTYDAANQKEVTTLAKWKGQNEVGLRATHTFIEQDQRLVHSSLDMMDRTTHRFSATFRTPAGAAQFYEALQPLDIAFENKDAISSHLGNLEVKAKQLMRQSTNSMEIVR